VTFEALIEHYGYFAIFAGTLLEGETVLILGGFAAHRGYLSLPWVMAAALAGSLVGDQLYYYLGRRYGNALPARFERLRPRLDKVRGLLQRHPVPLILGLRFLYGLRTVGPLAIGMSGIPPWLFLALDTLGALLWSVAVAGAGYLFGQTLEWLLADLRHYELEVMAAIAACGLGLWLLHHRRR